jgi:hypothetical protein
MSVMEGGNREFELVRQLVEGQQSCVGVGMWMDIRGPYHQGLQLHSNDCAPYLMH